jgi:hypothetical protein
MESGTDRTGELLRELMGAQMMTKMVEETWAAMPAERRAALAVAVADAFEARLKNGSHMHSDLYGLFDSMLGPLAAAAFELKRAEMEQLLIKYFEDNWKARVAHVAGHAFDRALAQVRDKFWPEPGR